MVVDSSIILSVSIFIISALLLRLLPQSLLPSSMSMLIPLLTPNPNPRTTLLLLFAQTRTRNKMVSRSSRFQRRFGARRGTLRRVNNTRDGIGSEEPFSRVAQTSWVETFRGLCSVGTFGRRTTSMPASPVDDGLHQYSRSCAPFFPSFSLLPFAVHTHTRPPRH